MNRKQRRSERVKNFKDKDVKEIFDLVEQIISVLEGKDYILTFNALFNTLLNGMSHYFRDKQSAFDYLSFFHEGLEQVMDEHEAEDTFPEITSLNSKFKKLNYEDVVDDNGDGTSTLRIAISAEELHSLGGWFVIERIGKDQVITLMVGPVSEHKATLLVLERRKFLEGVFAEISKGDESVKLKISDSVSLAEMIRNSSPKPN